MSKQYICKKCEKNFGNRKSNYLQHMSKKTSCIAPKLEQLTRKYEKMVNMVNKNNQKMNTFIDLYKYCKYNNINI